MMGGASTGKNEFATDDLVWGILLDIGARIRIGSCKTAHKVATAIYPPFSNFDQWIMGVKSLRFAFPPKCRRR
jgi:hypothetical protein